MKLRRKDRDVLGLSRLGWDQLGFFIRGVSWVLVCTQLFLSMKQLLLTLIDPTVYVFEKPNRIEPSIPQEMQMSMVLYRLA